MTIKFLKGNFRFFKKILDGHPAILVENGVILTDQCMRFGMQAAELKMKLRAAGVQRAKDIKRAILEQNGQLKVVKFGEENVLLDPSEILLVSPLCTIFILSSKSFTAGCFPLQLTINIIIIPRIIKILFFIPLPLSIIIFF